MISVIICSINTTLRSAIKENIKETIGVEHEVIIIENDIHQYPIAKAYNLGAEQAKYPYLCFSHEDICFHTPSWGKQLIHDFEESEARLMGVLGCAVKAKGPSSVYLAYSNTNYVNHLQRHRNKPTTLFYENPGNKRLAEVCILDGLFIASSKTAWEETKFSEEYLDGFHGYDIDFCLKNFLKGKVVVTFNILLEHFSNGSFDQKWVDVQIMLSERWKDYLPLSSPSVSTADVKKAELQNLKEFIKFMIEADSPPSLQWKYFLKHLVKSPFEKINLYFLRRIVLRNKMNNYLKSHIKRMLPRYKYREC